MTDGDLSGRTLGDITLCDLIAEGGHGAVYRGEQRLLGRDVVVKVLHGQRRRNPVAHERFLREAQLASRLDHPYAAHIYAFGIEEADGLLWIAMEFVHGVTLHRWLTTRGPMVVEQFVPFFEKVAQVVHAAHQQGIVHRDLKPSNVMVIEQDGSLFPKLLDFGIAKAPPEAKWIQSRLPAVAATEDVPDTTRAKTVRIRGKRPAEQGTPTHTSPLRPPGDPQLTHPGSGIGSAAYMSPEQWHDAWAVGPATDIYALGVLAYKVLTGGEPFVGEHTDDYYRMHHSALAPPLGGDFSPAIDSVVQRALAKLPQDRHGSALEMAAALRAALRSSEREQLRSAAQQWADRHQAPGFLWGRDALPDLERARRVPAGQLSPLECSFVAASHRRARRAVWVRRALGTLLVLIVFGGALYHARMQARLASQRAELQTRLAEATATQSELEQGRSALLHAESDAALHLGRAFQRDPQPSTAFMFARALRPRLAEQARLTSSSGRMWSAAFSPDGHQVVTTDDKNAQIWDAQTGRLVATLPHVDTVHAATYFANGSRLVTAAGDGAARIWDAQRGTLVRELRRNGAKPHYVLVALSPDGRFVAAMDLEVAHVWDVASGTCVAELRTGATSGWPSLAFSSDSRWLAVGGGNDVRVFDAGRWSRVLTVPGPGIDGLSWDPSGPRLLTGSNGGDVSIWQIPDGTRAQHLREIGAPVDAVAYSPDGHLVVAASRNGDELVWRAATGALESQGNVLRGKIRSIEFDRSSTRVVAAGTSGAVAVTNATDGMPIAVLEGPQNVVMVAHFDRDAGRVVAASWDGTARIWDATSPYHAWGTPPVDSDCGLVSSLEPDGRFVAVGCKEHPTRIWDTSRGQVLAELPSVTPIVGDLASAFPAVSQLGERAAIARGSAVEVYAVAAAQLITTITHRAAVSTVAFGAGRDVVTGAVDGSLVVTRDNGAVTAFPRSSAGIDVAGFLPDGRIVAADAERHLRVYSPAGAILAELMTSARVRTLRMAPDGARLITVPSFMGAPALPELWDVERYQLVSRLEGHGQAYGARFVGAVILTAWGDGSARLWASATGRLQATYRGGSRFLVDATLSSDGTMVIGGGGDGILRFWDAETARPLWTLTAHSSHLVGIRVEDDEIVTRGFSGEISRWALPSPQAVIDACSQHEHCAIVSR